jgi:Reversibly glycosylated polypeptide
VTGPSFAVVCTTIGDGSFLKDYAKALEGADARMFVIPDRKTPAPLYAAVEDYRASGLRVDCPDLNEQTAFLARLGAPEGMFPWDTDHRRNVGYLMACESGADIVISVDDDNLPREGWLEGHTVVGAGSRKLWAAGHDGTEPVFWNPLDLLGADSEPRLWPRGFPYPQRGKCHGWAELMRCDVAVNTGLWLGSPDVDAITRLALNPQVHAEPSGSTVLGANMWAPVNSQNTAVRREVIPAYYFFRSPRFGDIYQGYLAQACAKHLGHTVRFGTPVVRHERNDHDLLKDLEAELPDMLILDRWLDWLTAASPEGGSYGEAYESLSHQMQDHIGGTGSYTPGQAGRLHHMAMNMRDWLKLCERIG